MLKIFVSILIRGHHGSRVLFGVFVKEEISSELRPLSVPRIQSGTAFLSWIGFFNYELKL